MFVTAFLWGNQVGYRRGLHVRMPELPGINMVGCTFSTNTSTFTVTASDDADNVSVEVEPIYKGASWTDSTGVKTTQYGYESRYDELQTNGFQIIDTVTNKLSWAMVVGASRTNWNVEYRYATNYWSIIEGDGHTTNRHYEASTFVWENDRLLLGRPLGMWFNPGCPVDGDLGLAIKNAYAVEKWEREHPRQ